VPDRFQLFRLSLTPRDRDLFTFDQEPPSREGYLRTVFTQGHDFEHRGNLFVYVPAPEQPKPFIIGQVGRPHLREENLPPEQGFRLAQHEAWRVAVFAFDPRAHDDGQKVSFSRDTLVGEPPAVLDAFLKNLNQADGPYRMEIEPIFNTRTFWVFAEEHKNLIHSLRFEFVTPNMFGLTDNLDEELRDIRTKERAQLVDVKFRSQDGLNTNTDRIREGVEYAGRGTGRVIASSKDGAHFNSRDQAETVTIEEDDPGESLLKRAIRGIKEVLGIK
jgi:hypothetical protein